MNKYLLSGIVCIITALYVISQLQQPTGSKFQQWKIDYNANFNQEQNIYRNIIFNQNLAIIQNHNTDFSQAYKMAINQFTILTPEQFKQIYLGTFTQQSYVEADGPFIVGAQVDWTTKGKVSLVKDQGKCGSCWAFSATGVCQSFELMKGNTVLFSQQQLIDCTRQTGNHGCSGGSRQIALKYIRDSGIQTEASYPYQAKDQSCKKKGGPNKIVGYTSLSGCTNINNALQSRPIAVAVDASNWSHYSSGIFSNCGSNIDHAVLLVGVSGTYWKIKNSWGTGWGEHGFIRLGIGNTCGMCNQGGLWVH